MFNMNARKSFVLIFILVVLCSGIVLVFQAAGALSPFPDGISSYWKLDETNGTTFKDEVGNNTDGSSIAPGIPTSATGRVNGAQDFDGINDFIEVPDDPSLDWGSADSFTIELWANFVNVTGFNRVMIGRDQFSGVHWWLGAVGGSGYVNWHMQDKSGGNITVTGSTALNDGKWHHIVAVRDENNDTNRIYVDGVEVASEIYDYQDGFDATTPLGMGYMAFSGSPGFFYQGLLDETALYNRALTVNEILQHYNDGLEGRGYEVFYKLTVGVSGSGTTTPAVGAHSYVKGSVVTVSATAGLGWSFVSWSGALSGTASQTTITMDANKTVTATFVKNTYNLTVSKVGNGTVTFNSSGPYEHGDVVQLTAVPNAGWVFAGWSGALTGTNNPGTITIDANKAVTATFSETVTPTTLNVTVSPTSQNLTQGQAATFSASVSGGDAPYTYQWYLNGTAVSGAIHSTYSFTPEAGVKYSVYVKVTDAEGAQVQSDAVTDITVTGAGAEEDNAGAFPILLVAIVVAVLVIVGGLLVYFVKRKRA